MKTAQRVMVIALAACAFSASFVETASAGSFTSKKSYRRYSEYKSYRRDTYTFGPNGYRHRGREIEEFERGEQTIRRVPTRSGTKAVRTTHRSGSRNERRWDNRFDFADWEQAPFRSRGFGRSRFGR